VILRAAAAVLLAVILWVIVSAEESAATWVPVRVVLALDSAVALRDPVPPVRAFVVGPRRDLLQLVQSPPLLQRAVTSDDADSVRIELYERDLDLPTGSDARVRDVKPRMLTIRLKPAHDSLRRPLYDTARTRVGVR